MQSSRVRHIFLLLTHIQPPKAPPKIYQILLKTHKLTIFLTVEPSTQIQSLKEEALDALTSDVNQAEDVPTVSSLDEFQIVKAKDDAYTPLNDEDQVKDCKIAGWDILFLQFKDPTTGEDLQPLDTQCSRHNLGDFLPVQVTQPSLDDDEEDGAR